MLTDSPVNIRAKFPLPSRAVVLALIQEYNGEPLPLDPGPGSVETSYRLSRDLLRQKAILAREAHPSVFLRRLLLDHFQKQHKAILAPARSVPAPALVQPKMEPVALPKGNDRIELNAEQAKAALIRIGACQSPQPSSHYFLCGTVLTREENGQVLGRWELER